MDKTTVNTEEFCRKAHDMFGGSGWKANFAAYTGKDYATVKRWAAGELAVPLYAQRIVELLEFVPEHVRPIFAPRVRTGRPPAKPMPVVEKAKPERARKRGKA